MLRYLTRDEAEKLIDKYIDEIPLDDALERAMNHDWSFDPTTTTHPNAAEADEIDEVLYGLSYWRNLEWMYPKA